jgi:hypothetical protein
MTQILSKYKLASQIDNERNLRLSHEDFTNLCLTLEASGGEKNVARVCAFLKSIPREELIWRSAAVARLHKLLSIIKHNAIQNTPTR